MDAVRNATLSGGVAGNVEVIAAIRNRFATGRPELNAARATVAGGIRVAAVRVGTARTRDSRGSAAPPCVVADQRRSGIVTAMRAGRVATDIANGNAAHAKGIAGFTFDAAIGIRTTRGETPAGRAAFPPVARHNSVTFIATVRIVLANACPEADAARAAVAGRIRVTAIGVDETRIRRPRRCAALPGLTGHRSEALAAVIAH